MELKLIKALWGMSGTLEEQFRQIAEAGYKGIEAGLPSLEQEGEFRELLSKYQLEYIAMVFTGGDHISSFADQVQRAASFQPILINSHSAKDSMSFNDQLNFFEHALRIEKEIGLPIGHETHRGRAMFTPWITSKLLKELPDLKITADFSHWCCVCESLLWDQDEHLSVAFDRTLHIHGRVGYAEGPQVSDPSAPEYRQELDQHIKWWQEVCKLKAKQGNSTITFTPEYGPPGYMHTLPHTNQPVADLWSVCLWMAKYFESKFNEFSL